MTREPGTQAEWGVDPKIGARVRHARLLQGLTMNGLAERVGCDTSMISKIEADKNSPSIAMLHRIAGALNHDLASFFAEEANSSPFVSKSDERSISSSDEYCGGVGLSYESLVPISGSNHLDGNIHTIEPGSKSSDHITRRGETIGYIIKGTVELKIEGKTYLLNTGDSFFFKNYLTSSCCNVGSSCAKVLWVSTPRI